MKKYKKMEKTRVKVREKGIEKERKIEGESKKMRKKHSRAYYKGMERQKRFFG